jgi:hypothetical protein
MWTATFKHRSHVGARKARSNESAANAEPHATAGLKAIALFDQADAEGRQLTLEERAVAEDRVRRFKDLQSKQQVLDVAGRIGVSGVGDVIGGDGRPLVRSDAGRAFVESEGASAPPLHRPFRP